MHIIKSCRIAGTGKYLPSRVISSSDMEVSLGLPAGWIQRFSGVRERHFADGETNADMAVYALREAIKHAGMGITDLDMIISASVTFDYILPYQAALVLKGLSEDDDLNMNIPTLDVHSSCLSFLTALDLAATLLDGKKYRNIAIVSSEVASKGLNPGDREVYTLFGDGAAAVILSDDSDAQQGIVKSHMSTYPEGYYYSIIKGGGNVYHTKYYVYDPKIFSFTMEGIKLLKLAKRKLPPYFDIFFSDIGISMEDVDVIITHQASKVGLELFRSLYPRLKGILFSNLETHGNCISASIPMCLHDAIEQGILSKGQSCLLAGTAAGFAIGSILIKY
jgi:3-oxoacyl-[acyl-carrier-protein] synthase III